MKHMDLKARTTLIAVVIALLAVGVFREPISAASAAVKGALEVLITNDSTQPVPVREARMEVVQLAKFTSFTTGDRFTPDVVLYTVPAGKILVIDSLSGECLLQPADRLMEIRYSFTFEGGLAYTISLHPDDEGIFTSTNAHVFRGSLATTAYASAGTMVTAFGVRDGTSLSGTSMTVGFAGHLIDAP
jgi:hypothetical protein